jgi:hypothetical protein
MQKQQLVFFPARFQQPLPKEMYANFISKLSDNYDVHIATTNNKANLELLENIFLTKCSEYDNIGLISHSTGVADLWNVYDLQQESKSIININKIILIEPLDFAKSTPSSSISNFDPMKLPMNFMSQLKIPLDFMKLSDINVLNSKIESIVETDYIEVFKSNIFGRLRLDKKTKEKTNQNEDDDYCDYCDYCDSDGSDDTAIKSLGQMLVIKHKQSDKWRFIPTVPPLSKLNSELVDFEKTMKIDEVMIDKFSHFDILDRPWANLMNRASLTQDKKQEELNEYLDIVNGILYNLYNVEINNE